MRTMAALWLSIATILIPAMSLANDCRYMNEFILQKAQSDLFADVRLPLS